MIDCQLDFNSLQQRKLLAREKITINTYKAFC